MAPADLFLRRKEPLLWMFVGLPVLGDPFLGLWCLGTCSGEACVWLIWGELDLLSLATRRRVGDKGFLLGATSVSSRHSSFLEQY